MHLEIASHVQSYQYGEETYLASRISAPTGSHSEQYKVMVWWCFRWLFSLFIHQRKKQTLGFEIEMAESAVKGCGRGDPLNLHAAQQANEIQSQPNIGLSALSVAHWEHHTLKMVTTLFPSEPLVFALSCTL